MKVNLFSPILILLVITLVIKASMLFGRIEEQANYTFDTSVTSILIDTAYAKDGKENSKPALLNHSGTKDILPNHDDTDSAGFSKINTLSKTDAVNALPEGIDALKATETGLPNLSSSELKLLKELSKRRQELQKNQDEIEVKQQILRVTESKIDQKMIELKTMQAQLEELMKQYDQKEQGKILSLVKIYENMRPKDAAKIFDELEMPVLIQVVSNMKEIKVAHVIAGMHPLKARDLSIELAKQKSINN